eukprot:SM000032S12033  [mRNA]  locus=s32:57742:59335:+ [translate_table: standard]
MPVPPVPLRKSRPRRRPLRRDTGATVANCLTHSVVPRPSLWLAPRRRKRRLSAPRATELAPRGEPAPSHRRPDSGPGATIPPAASLPSFWLARRRPFCQALDGGRFAAARPPHLLLPPARRVRSCCLPHHARAARPPAYMLSHGSHAMFTSQLEELDTCYPSAIHAGSFPDESLEDQTLLESIQALSAAEVDQVVWPNRNPVIYEGRPVSEGRESSTTAATEFKQVLPKSRRSSTSGSCAPCQHQHKSCKENCDLKIPSMHPCKEPALKNWIKVHKAYGSSKIYKMVERTHRGDRERLMQRFAILVCHQKCTTASLGIVSSESTSILTADCSLLAYCKYTYTCDMPLSGTMIISYL